MREIGPIMVFWACLAAQAAESPRLAVLPTSPDLAAPSDLLIVELSAKPGITLLEREQIQKLWREQEIADAQSRDFVRLGRTLNADGLLLLEIVAEPDNKQALAARLIAVKPGVIVAEHRFPFPLPKPEEWAKSYPSQIQNLFPKFGVKLEDAVPISLLNLRSSVSTSDGVALEQELTSLLQFRLTHETAVFVLERRKMEALQEEKQLTGAEPEPFWNSAYVLDGTINRDVVSRERVTINARLTSKGGAPVNLSAEGRRDSLTRIVDDLARKVLDSIGKAATFWRPDAEAERLRQEAEWAWGWGLLGQVLEAADASWSLGQHSQPVAAYRVASRASLGLSMRGPLHYEDVGVYGFRPPPGPEALPLFSRALELYRDGFQEFSAGTNCPGAAWGSVGLDILLATAQILERYHDRVEFREGHEQELGRVRELAREVNALLTTNSVLGPSGWTRSGRRGTYELPTARYLTKNGPVTSLWQAWFDAGGVWFDKPQDALNLYRRLLVPSIYGVVRGGFLSTRAPLAAWSFADRQMLPATWMGFAREMASSTNVQIRLDGLRLILERGLDETELESTAHLLYQEAWDARLSIFENQQGAVREVDCPAAQLLTNVALRVEQWGRASSERFWTLAADWSRRFTEAEPDLSYQVWKELIAKITDPKGRGFAGNVSKTAPRPEQVRELLAEFEAIERSGLHGSMRNYTEQIKYWAGLSNEVSQLPLTNTAVRYTPSRNLRKLRISREWSLAKATPPPNRHFGWEPRASHLVWHQDRLWLETLSYKAPYQGVPSPTIVALDPNKMQAEVIQAPFDGYGDGFYPYTPRRRVHLGNELFIYDPGVLWRRDAQGRWTRLPVPVSGWAVPYVWGKHIVLSADQSILDVDPQTLEAKVLASSRRSPPATALDRAWNVRQPPLAIWPGEKLCALMGGSVWSYDPISNDWNITLSEINCGSLELQPTGVIYHQADNRGARLLGGWRAGSSLLEYYTWEPRNRTDGFPAAALYTPPVWVHPEGTRPNESQARFDGPNVWVFPAPVGNASFSPDYGLIDELGRKVHAATNFVPTTILYLDRRFQRSLELLLDLGELQTETAKAFENAQWGAGIFAEFLPTPEGLAILLPLGGTVLWIPKADLDSALAEAAQRDPQPLRSDYAALERFDRDHNGWLDDSERRAMREDAAWQKEQQASLDTTIKASLATHRTDWQKVFMEADKNHDGKLSASEIRSAATSHPEIFWEHVRGLNTALDEAMGSYDVDGDLAYNASEFESFLADPRPLASNIGSAVPAGKKTRKLTLTRHWSLETSTPPRDRSFGARPNGSHLFWESDRLWLETKSYHRPGQMGGSPTVVSLDPKTMQSEAFAAPFEDVDSRPFVLNRRRAVVIGKELFFCGEGMLWRRDAKEEWHSLRVPNSGWAVPYAWGRRILLSGEESITEVDPATAQARVLADSRRQPPLTALDRVGPLSHPPLGIWPKGNLSALVGGQVWTYDTAKKDWILLLSATNCGETLDLQAGGVVYHQSGECAPASLGGWRPGSTLLEYYTWENSFPKRAGAPIPSFTPPLWNHEQDSRPHDRHAVFDGPNLWVFPLATGMRNFEPAPVSDVHEVQFVGGRRVPPPKFMIPTGLMYFDRRFERPVALELDWGSLGAEITKAFESAQRTPRFHAEFLVTPAGLAILLSERGIVVWVPKDDLENALVQAAKGDPQLERLDVAAFRRFDHDQKGWLDDAERRAMRHDPAWRQEYQAALEAASKKALAEHGAAWDTIFSDADANHDGKLSGGEFEAAMIAHQEMFAHRLRGVNVPLTQAMRPYAVEQDYTYTLSEFRSFAADPRPLAEMNRSAEWVTKLGLKPEQCDTNDDGIIDTNERASLRNLIKQVRAKASAKAN